MLYIFLPRYSSLLFLIVMGHILIFVLGMKLWRLQFFGKVWYRFPTEPGKIALTFDDGPDPHLTEEILSILKTHSFKATFFVIGTKAEKYPHIVKKCYDQGHTIACHDLSHSLFSNFRVTSALIADIRKSQTIIQNIIGKKPLLYRPPFGLMNPHTLKALHVLNMKCIGWSKSVGDAGNRRMTRIVRINRLALGGEIVLIHDTLPKIKYKKEILNQIHELCISIKRKKLESVSIDTLFSIQAYIEN